MQTNHVIKLADIHKVYHTGEVDVHAVRGISLEVFPGEFVALMGASGSGKSTLMNMIGALDRPSGGNYLLDGIDVSTLDRDALADVRNEKIGFVFQGFNLLSRTSALENVEMPMLYNRHRIAAHEQRERAKHALELVGLGARADHHPNQLSGGQQQRVAIARALVNQPSLLLADEPTGNLDSQTSIEIMGVFQKLNDQGITIVMVTHELDVARFTKRMVILRDGKIVTDEKVADRLNAEKELDRLKQAQAGGQTRMRIFASLRIAGRALLRNKMRSLLTMLGIIIGVGAVIGSVSLTSGATKQVEDQVSSLGESVITVFSGNFTSGAMRGGWGSAPTLTVADALAIAGLKNVVAVSPEVRDRAQVLANGLNWNTQVMGESPDYPQIRNWGIAKGAMFSDQDVRSLAKTAVIGQTVADELFPNENPVGQTIRIRNLPFLIVGVLAPKGFNLFGQDQDDTVVVPYTSHMHRITTRIFLNDILVEAANDKAIEGVQNDITDLLLMRHRSKEQDFTVRNQLELMQMRTAASRLMGSLLAGVAAVSLVVGGIGIMNIMLVSVTERTREIGIRMAVGARAADILVQFLIEAVTLSAIGGFIGIIGGVGFSETVAYFKDMPTVTPVAWIAIAFISSAIIGIISGFYPAWKASKLDPIDALRYE